MNDSSNHSRREIEPPKQRQKSLLIKIAAWTLAGVLVLLILAAATVAILLHSERFHNYVLTTAQQKASESLGVRVQLQNFALNLSHLDLDIYGVTIDGAAPYANPPLLQVDHAEVGVKIVSIVSRKWYLSSFRVDRPIVRIYVDSKGVSNIPVIHSDSNGSSTSVFDLGIRHAVLDHGEVYYNDRKGLLAADLHDVDFQASFDSLQQKYTGKLAYSDGHLTSGTLQTIPHSLQAEFEATPTAFHLSHATLSTGLSQISLVATLQNYANPIADAHYDALIDGQQVGQILNSPSVPTGKVHATGDVHYRQIANRPILDALLVNGDIYSSELDVKTTSIRTQLRNLAGHYSLDHGDATLKDLRLDLLGGTMTATGTMTNVAADSHSKVNAILRGVSLADIKRLAGTSNDSVAIKGALNADLSATWGSTFDDLIAQADSTINGSVSKAAAVSASSTISTGAGRPRNRYPKKNISTVSAPQANPAATVTNQPGSVQLTGAIHARYTAASKQLALKNSFLRTPQTNLAMDGTIGNRSSLDIHLQADDLREVESVADLFREPAKGQSLQPLGLSGIASFRGQVTGSTTAPHLTGQFIATNLTVSGSEWKVIRTGIEVSPSQVSLQHADLEPASRGHIRFDASSALTHWSFTNTSPVQISLDASQLNIADITKLTGQQIPVSGTLTANLKLHGTELNPVGDGDLSIDKLVAYDQPFTSFKINFSGTGDEAHADLAAQLPDGAIKSNVSVRPRDRTYTAKLSASNIHLDKLQTLKARNVDASGEVSLNASGQGSFDNPQLDVMLQIPQLVIQKQKVSDLKLTINVANHVANAALASSIINTSIQAKAKVDLTGDYLADATLDTQAIPFQPLLAIYAPEQAANLSGETELHATLHGPLNNQKLLEAHVTIPTLKMAYGSNIQLASASPIHVDYKNGVVDVQRASIKGTDTDIQFQGTIPVIDRNAPMSVMMQGEVNLQLAQLFDPDIRTSGEVKFNINSTGTSDFGGKIDIVNASYASTDLPVGLQNGNGTLTLTRDRLSISKFQGTIGGGTVTAQGGVALRPAIQFDLGVAAQGIRMLYPQGMREGIDANLRLAGTTDAATLAGSVNLTDISFTSAFDLNSFIGQFTGGVSTPPTPGFAQNLQLNMNVRSSSDINLVSRTLSVDGSANLQVRGTAANPVILGRVNLNGGDIILNGDRFVLDGGTVQFVNPSETEPVLNVSLKTTIQQYDVYLRFNGPVDQLRTNYSSDPSLPAADIINLLAFGNTTEANTANQATPANQQAAGLVASQVSSQVTSRVSKIAGISQLSINPVLAGGTTAGPQGANITIQQRVTGNLFVTFSTNVASTQNQTIQGQYQLSPRVALSVTRDQNGGVAFDALIKKSW